jgi:pimeloyl-ACP methyl ester carboxylesterase
MSEWNLPYSWDTGRGVVRWDFHGEGPPLVLLHGTPFSSFIWRDVVPVLALENTVYVWDMLGFGESDKDAADVSLATQTTVFAGLLSHWEVHQPRVIAHDVGGVVALRAALIDGVDFSDLTLIDAASVTGWGTGGFFQTVRAHPNVFSQLPDWATDALIAAKIRSGSHVGLRPEVLRVYLDQWRTPEGRQAFYRQYAQGGEEHTDELQGQLSALRIPVHVIWGRNDQWLGLDYADRLVQELPAHARFTLIEGAGHTVPEDQPGALLRHLTAER